MVDDRHAPKDWDPSCAVVYPEICSAEEADILANDILTRMKRRRYEKGHWDAVITSYKEIELEQDDSSSTVLDLFTRLRKHLEDHHFQQQQPTWFPCHAIDLKKNGELNAHVDSIKFSGDLVAGLSLLSPSIMKLKPDPAQPLLQNDDSGYVDLYLPPRSLYTLTGVGRYRYTHELLPTDSIFTNPISGEETIVERDHRLSVIFRDTK